MATNTFNLPPNLLESVCYVETHHNVSAYKPNDGGSPSYGICMVKYQTARGLGYNGNAQGLMDPKVNAYYAAKYLRYQIDRYDSIERGVIAFNRGNAKGLHATKYSAKVMKQWRGNSYATQND